MADKPTRNFREKRRLIGLALMSCAAAALFAGCKGNSSAAAMMERTVGPPPVVNVHWAAANPLHANPLSGDLWKHAPWMSLVQPANSDRSTPACKARVLVDRERLYVAFVSELAAGETLASPPSTAPDEHAPPDRDLISLFLDIKGDGTEILQFSAGPSGRSDCTRIRAAIAPTPREDGTPNMNQSVELIPHWQVDGLETVAGAGESDGRPVWTLVYSIPFQSLPLPFRVTPAGGEHWKFNLLRTISADGDLLQANLSPVFVGAQAVSPYRMAELDVSQP